MDKSLFEKRLRLTSQQKNYLFAHLIRINNLLSIAKNLLEVKDIDKIVDPHFIAFWQSTLNVINSHDGILPTPNTKAKLLIEIECDKLLNDQNLFSEQDREFLLGEDGYIDWVFDLDESTLSEDDALKLLVDYLEERTVYTPVQNYVNTWGGLVPTTLEPFLKQIDKQRSKILGIGTNAVEEVFPEQWRPEPLGIIPTGLSFIDRMMAGGRAHGEVYTIMGVSGGGKTTLLVQLLCQAALIDQTSNNEQLGHHYFFSYESPVKPDILHRIWAHTAQIDYTTFVNDEPLSSLSKKNYKPYEKERFAEEFAAGLPVPGEEERFLAAKGRFANQNLWPVDFSGTYGGVGTGGVSEIAALLESEQNKGRKISSVAIDYAGISIQRYMSAHNIDRRLEFQFIASYVDEIRTQIAARFNCTCWIAHQLHGDTAKKSPGAKMHHSDARGTRNFVDNAWFAFELGTVDLQTNCLLIHCTKQRRAKPTPPSVVMLDGAVRTLIDADKEFSLDLHTSKIIPKSFLNYTADADIVNLKNHGFDSFSPGELVNLDDDFEE